MKYFYLLFLPFLLCYTTLQANDQATEIRAIWLTTNWKLDWPQHGKTVNEQKQELEQILDGLQKNNFNVVLFQARAQGRVFYKSQIEEASPFFNSANGFDPLAFVIEACHAREMECHAWITTFPMEKVKTSRRGTVVEKKPSYYKRVNTHWFMDPGSPETKHRLVAIAKEIVSKYDVDGLHLDYIRYPDNPQKFSDNDTYQRYGNGKNKSTWRRENINNIIFDIYDTVKSIKNWVQVSSAPLGKYKALRSGDGWTAYETVYQDAGYWMRMNKHDILFPMMYHKGKDFYPHVDSWLETSNNRFVIPGIGAYQLEENERNWQISEIADQVKFTREKAKQGIAFFRAEQILKNKKGVRNIIENIYKYPAKLPPLTWLSNTKPQPPKIFEVFKNEKGALVLRWQAPDANHRYTYNVYYSDHETLDLNNPEKILKANYYNGEYSFPASVGEYGFYYFVTATDRYHNESEPAESVFFVHSEGIH